METRIPILRVGKVLLASIQVELEDAVGAVLQEDLLEALGRTDCRGILIDVTGVPIIDSHVARLLLETAKMAKLMGAESVLVGVRPEVAATLVRMGFPLGGVQTALDIDGGLALLDEPPPAARR